MIAFLVLLAVLFIIVVGVEAVTRVVRIPLEVSRKTTHILTGIAVAFSAWYVPQPYLVALALMFIAVILISRSRGIFRSIHDSERSGLGDLWYPAGILLAALLFSDPAVFMYAVLVLAVSDGLAGLLGKTFGKRRISFISTPKTYLGSGVFIISTFVLSLMVLPWPLAAGAAVYLALVEALSIRGLDNLILPLAAGAIAMVFAG